MKGYLCKAWMCKSRKSKCRVYQVLLLTYIWHCHVKMQWISLAATWQSKAVVLNDIACIRIPLQLRVHCNLTRLPSTRIPSVVFLVHYAANIECHMKHRTFVWLGSVSPTEWNYHSDIWCETVVHWISSTYSVSVMQVVLCHLVALFLGCD